MTDVELELQVNGQFPSIEEYEERRKGSSAVAVTLSMEE
jgi:hypothetical protein